MHVCMCACVCVHVCVCVYVCVSEIRRRQRGLHWKDSRRHVLHTANQTTCRVEQFLGKLGPFVKGHFN